MRRVLIFAGVGLVLYLIAVAFMVAGLRGPTDVEGALQTETARGSTQTAQTAPTQAPRQPAQPKASATTPPPPPGPDLSGWQDYASQTGLGLSLKVPPEWTAKETRSDASFQKAATNQSLFITVATAATTNKDELLKAWVDETKKSLGAELTDLDQATLKINGKDEVVKYYQFKKEGKDRVVALAVTLAGNKQYKLESYMSKDQYSNKDERGTVEIMLSTIKAG